MLLLLLLLLVWDHSPLRIFDPGGGDRGDSGDTILSHELTSTEPFLLGACVPPRSS